MAGPAWDVAGSIDRAERVALNIGDRVARDRALAAIVSTSISSELPDATTLRRAERAADTIAELLGK